MRCCGDDLKGVELKAIQLALAQIATRPASIDELVTDIPAFNARLAVLMLANAMAFGPWKSTRIDLSDRFVLYLDKEQAQTADSMLLQSIDDTHAPLVIRDPLLIASAMDVAKARKRLARLDRIAAGEERATRRMRELAMQVSRAMARGQSALSACLTSYCKSGNRVPRLLTEQEQAIDNVISKKWHTGKVQRKKDLMYAIEKECQQSGVEPCGRSSVYARLKKESPIRHALNTGGFRAFHAVRPSTDPRSRSMPPIGYGQVLHIDSSDLDVRCAPNLLQDFPDAKTKFYIGIDGATGDTMAHALIFGPARTDGLALLIREYVKRHVFLPQIIHLDRGPENTSHWIEEFCDYYGIILRYSPTAGSAWNGAAESAIKQINDQVAHRMVGSTEPDQKGRKVDGFYKSRNNAKTDFTSILEQFIAFAYGDLPRTPRADGKSPSERKDEVISTYGIMGRPCEWSDDFLIQTSIKIRRKGKLSAQRGIRTADGYFSSDELLVELRTQKPDQLRSDCCDPSILYVQIGRRWFKAFHSRVLSLALLSDNGKLFELLWAPIGRANSRHRREDLSRARHTRLKLAEAARPAIEHLAPDQPSADESLSPSLEDDPGPLWTELRPFEIIEDHKWA